MRDDDEGALDVGIRRCTRGSCRRRPGSGSPLPSWRAWPVDLRCGAARRRAASRRAARRRSSPSCSASSPPSSGVRRDEPLLAAVFLAVAVAGGLACPAAAPRGSGRREGPSVDAAPRLDRVSTLPYDDDYGPAVLAPAAARRRRPAERLLEGLNPQQRQAVVHEGGPLLIVAGAGSGKTKALTTRIAYLLAARGVQPGEVLAITFTNKAAGEMNERVAALVGSRARAMWVITFHSACVRILRAEAKKLGFTTTFSIYDPADAQRLMTLVCRDLDLDPKRFPARSMSNQVSDLKNELVDCETAREQGRERHGASRSPRSTRPTRRGCSEANAMDFDDLIMTTVDLLQAFPDVAEHYRRRFRHVLVDEYQDTNHAQYVLVRELVGARSARRASGRLTAPARRCRRAELCVVGDADQSIYAFRGADIRNILDFEKDYPDATVVLLEQNYRSTQTILSAANAVIAKNPGRKDKRLWTDSGDGEQIVGYVADNEHDEAAFVAGEVDRLADEHGVKPREVAVFYRTNAQSPGVRGGVHPGRAAVQGRRRRALLRAQGGPRRAGLPAGAGQPGRHGRRCAASSTPRAAASATGPRRASRRSRPASGSRSPRRCAAATRCRGMATRAAKAVAGVRRPDGRAARAGRRRHAAGRGASRRCWTAPATSPSSPPSVDPQDESRVENLAELVGVAREFSERVPDGGVAEFLEQVSLVADADQIPDADGERRRRHAHDAAHREGPRVPGRLPHRARGRRLPAPAHARRRARARGGAAARVRRHHPRARAALPVPRARAQRLGADVVQPAVALPRRGPGRARRLAARRVVGQRARRRR